MSNNGTILIVEDDADTRLGLSVRFRANNFSVLLAGDGTNGLAVAVREEPDLIVLDLGLPNGDGFAVLGWLRNDIRTLSIPVIILSARDPTLNRPKATTLGAKAFLQKPVDGVELMAEVQRQLEISRRERRLTA